MDDSLREELKQYVRLNQIFGPVNSTDVKELRCAAALFDWQNYVFAELLEGSDMLVGRRGSGKSSLIRSFGTRKYLISDFQSEDGKEFRAKYRLNQKVLTKLPDLVIDVDTAKEVHLLESFAARAAVVPPIEMMRDMWIRRIWRLIGRSLSASSQFENLLEAELQEYAHDTDMGDFDGGDVVSVDEYERRVSSALAAKGLHIVVTFDNVEEHKFIPTQNAVLAGLISAASGFMSAQNPSLDVKLCLPAEIFRQLKEITFRPDKDFASVQYLHWNPAELLHLAARRLRVYLEVWKEPELEFVKDWPIHDRKELRRFWYRYLPERITNGMGVSEDTLNYVMRHTQLLPRQLITILNAICSRARRAGRVPFRDRFDANDVVKGVQDSEDPGVRAICKMFDPVHPGLRKMLEEALPRLHRENTYGQVQKVWRSSARKHMLEHGGAEYRSFWQLMLSVGVLGVKIPAESTEIYSVARFEFNTKHSLQVSDKDVLCVHPMFSRIFNLLDNGNCLAILPRGSDFDFERERL
jgi:hypothetical protein